MSSSSSRRFEVDVSQRLVRIAVHGALTDEGLSEIHEQLWSDAAIRPDFAAWADLRAADPRPLTSEGVRCVARRSVPFEAEARCAIVVASDLSFGLARMYATLRGGRDDTLLVSRDADVARHWLVTGDEDRTGA